MARKHRMSNKISNVIGYPQSETNRTVEVPVHALNNYELDLQTGAIPPDTTFEQWREMQKGTGVSSLYKNDNGHLIINLTDGRSIDAGYVVGDPLTWDDLTPEQKESLKGGKGDTGNTPIFRKNPEQNTWDVSYDNGVSWVDTEAQYKGDKGTSWRINETTLFWEYSEDGGETWIETNEESKGDPFTYDDLTADQKEELAQHVTLQGGRIKAVDPGVLPEGPAGQTRYMKVTAVGTWTYGGVGIGSNADGYETTFWWDGNDWSNNGSVKIKGESGISKVEPWSNLETYSINDKVRDADYVEYISLSDNNTSALTDNTHWKVTSSDLAKTILGLSESEIVPLEQGYVNTSGLDVASPDFKRTGFLDTSKKYIVSDVYSSTNVAAVALYDSSKTFLQTYTPIAGAEVDYTLINNSAKFIRVSLRTIMYPDASVTSESVTKISLDNIKEFNLADIDKTYVLNSYNKDAVLDAIADRKTLIVGSPVMQNMVITNIGVYVNTLNPLMLISANKSGNNFTFDKTYSLVPYKLGLNEFDVNFPVNRSQHVGITSHGSFSIGIDRNATGSYYPFYVIPNNTASSLVTNGNLAIDIKYEPVTTDLNKDDKLFTFDDSGTIINNTANRLFVTLIPVNSDQKINRLRINSNAGSVRVCVLTIPFNSVINATINKVSNPIDVVPNQYIYDFEEMEVKKGQYIGIWSSGIVKANSSLASERRFAFFSTTDVSEGQEVTMTTSSGYLLYSAEYVNRNKVVNSVIPIERKLPFKGVKPLYIKTPYGDDEPLHPSVLYFPTGFNGYKYWMVETPYPYQPMPFYKDRYENPCIHVSNDGVNFITPTGLSNPIDDITNEQIANRDYLSDPCLVYNNVEGLMECWYRITYAQEDKRTEIIRKTSVDGITWSSREVLTDTDILGHQMRSMAILFEDNKYKIWYGGALGSSNIGYVEYNGSSFVNFQNVIVKVDGAGTPDIVPWHLDVQRLEDGKLVMLIHLNGTGYSNQKLQILESTDSAGTWFNKKKDLLTSTNNPADFYEKGLYKSCLVKAGDKWQAYICGNRDNRTYIALMEGSTPYNLEFVDGAMNDNDGVFMSNILAYGGKIYFTENTALVYDKNQRTFFIEDDLKRYEFFKL